MDPLIRVVNVVKSFGAVKAVNGISFDVMPGSVVGFIGANGAGKTTTMRIMSSIELPDSGDVLIDNVSIFDDNSIVRGRIGWMPDNPAAYDNLTVEEYIDFFARSYGLKGEQKKRRIKAVKDFTEIWELDNRISTKLSKGQSQRICLARSLISNPDILILDEPAAGLDPKARIDFKRLIKTLGEQGKTIFISSHILTELDDMCDSVIFIDKGIVVHSGGSEDLKKSFNKKNYFIIKFSGDKSKLEEAISLIDGVQIIDEVKNGVRLEIGDLDLIATSNLVRKLILDGVLVYEFYADQVKLEDVFVNMVSYKEEV